MRRRPPIPNDTAGLKHLIVSRRDAPLDGGLRMRCYFDVGDRLRIRAGCETDTVMLIRPDDHIAAIVPMPNAVPNAAVADIYQRAAHIKRPPGG
jgi:3-(3-hydroxy-phenyl)propionate hydroxylase